MDFAVLGCRPSHGQGIVTWYQSGLGKPHGLPKAKALGTKTVTNDRQHEGQGLVNPFLFLNRLMSRK